MNQLRRPLVVALFAFLAGLLPALRFAPRPILPGLAVLFVLVATLVAISRSRSSRSPESERVLLSLLLAATGGLAGSLTRVDADADCRAFLADDQRLVARGALGAAYRVDSAATRSPLLPLTGAVGGRADGTGACVGEIRIRIPPGQADLGVGDRIVAFGRWRTFTEPVVTSAWPDDPRFHGYLVVDSVTEVLGGSASASPFWLRLRGAADARLERVFPDHLPLVEGLLLGRREYIDPEIADRYTRSGLTHLLAISGTHVALLAGALLLLGGIFRIPRRRAVMLTIGATWVYLLIIGAPPSAVRSGVMITLTLLAILLQRPAAAGAIVAAAALAILAFTPLAILDPGFQLSFAGVLGIIFLRAPLLTLAPDQLQKRGLFRGLFDAFVIGIGAFLVTAPIVAHHFGVIAPISIVAGVPALPLTSRALIGIAAALAFDPLLPGVARLIAASTGACLDALDWIAGVAAAIPYGNGPIPPPPWWSWSIAAGIGLFAAAAVRRGSRRIRWIAGTGATIAALVAWPLVTVNGPDGLEIHFVDVGQGDAVAIRTPGDRWVLVDAGPASADFDAGQQRVLPFLRASGARRLEAFVLTHPDMDHIGGAEAVFAGIPVSFVFEPGHVVGKESYLDFLGAVDLHRTQWRAARAGRTMELDGVRFDFLWPDPSAVDASDDANQISAVMRITYGDFSLLLTGDAGVEVERLLVQRHGPDLRARILKLGHHGSDTSTDGGFLDEVRPELAVVSAGRRNRYGHPAPPVMERLGQQGVPVARTDLDGTVSLRVSRDGQSWSRIN